MKRFKDYSVYINVVNPHLDDVRHRQIEEFRARGDERMAFWLEGTGKALNEIVEDSSPNPIGSIYEQEVYKQLELIEGTAVGKLLLSAIPSDQKVWILPLDQENLKLVICTAFTFPGAPKEGGGIRIYYNPQYTSKPSGWVGSDDILFHELVHAYRMVRLTYEGLCRKQVYLYDDAEEFVATIMQNIYLGQRQSPTYYKAYQELRRISKSETYRYYSGEPETIMALRYFVENEPLVQTVARWVHISYNPFRDWESFERAFIRTIPPGVPGYGAAHLGRL